MKKLIEVGIIGLLLLIGVQKSDAVFKIVGTQGACDTTASGCSPIPLNITTLCIVTCPLRSSFSYTSSSRFWASKDGSVGACFTSINGGVTWANCTTQAFTAGSGGESYAGASDGSVIAVGTDTDCIIRRSTDNGTSWTTVFTEVASACHAGGQPGQYLYCLSSGLCEYVTNQAGTAKIYRSSNNGQSWTAGTTGTGGNCTIAGAQWDGSAGVMQSENPTCGGGNVAKTWVAVGDIWTDSVTWDGTQGHCWTPVVYNNVGRVICNNGTTGLRVYEASAALVAAITLPNSLDALDAQGPAVGFATNIMYIVGFNSTGTSISVWVSRDNLVTFVKIGDLGGGGAGPRGGNMFKANGCIYITTGLTPMFGKIC